MRLWWVLVAVLLVGCSERTSVLQPVVCEDDDKGKDKDDCPPDGTVTFPLVPKPLKK